jgi:hypothetical protein
MSIHTITLSRPLLILWVIGLILRLGWIALIFTPDFSSFEGGDYRLYELGGEYIRAFGNLQSDAFLVRPPLFPLLIALLNPIL